MATMQVKIADVTDIEHALKEIEADIERRHEAQQVLSVDVQDSDDEQLAQRQSSLKRERYVSLLTNR